MYREKGKVKGKDRERKTVGRLMIIIATIIMNAHIHTGETRIDDGEK